MTEETAPSTRPGRRDDSGFTLLEVVVSLVLLGVIAAAGLSFFLAGMRNTSHLQRGQAAVGVATEAMEYAKAVTATASASGLSPLVQGRSEAKVKAQWAAAGAMTELDDTYPAWDPGADATSIPVLPLDSSGSFELDVDVSGQTYHREIYVGTCYRVFPAVSSKPCDKIGTTPPASVPPSHQQLFRVVVVVTWPSTSATGCGPAGCSYAVSTVVDPKTNQTWNSLAKPIAKDDEGTVTEAGGATVPINVLSNDSLLPAPMNPVSVVNPPPSGQGTATPLVNGTIDFAPPTAFSGYTSFTYSAKDVTGQTSNKARVTVLVRPVPVDDTGARTGVGVPVDIDVRANDRGSVANLQPKLVTAPSVGTVTVNGSELRYSPPSGFTGVVTFTYTVEQYLPTVTGAGVATVSVEVVPPPSAWSGTVTTSVQTGSTTSAVNLLLPERSTFPAGQATSKRITVTSVSGTGGLGTFLVGSSPYSNGTASGWTVSFRPDRYKTGTASVTYFITDALGQRSPSTTAQVRVQ